MRPVRIGISLVLAGLGPGLALCPAAQADPGEPVLHEVTYTVYTDTPFFADIYYRDTEPPSYADYSHNPYEFSPKAEAELGPDRPWVLTVKLADPQFWAMVVATSGRSPDPPNFHCTLAVDGTVMVTDSGLKGALCSLRHW